MKLLVKLFIFAIIIMGTCYLPGISIESFYYALLVAVLITIFNMFVKPIMKLVALPINMFSLGLFNLVINMGLLYAVTYFIPQYKITSLLSGFIASVIIAVSYSLIKNS